MGTYAWVIDLILLLLIGGITYAVSSEGLWGAAILFVNVIFAGLVAFCVYEPCAKLIDSGLPFMTAYSDFFSLVVLFSFGFFLIRLATDNIAPQMVRFPDWLHHTGRIGFGAATAWYLIAMILCTLQTAPIHKQFLGYQWEQHALWGVGLDRFWLGFVQTTTERYLEWNPPRVFDILPGRSASFIMRYHEHRQFGQADSSLPQSTKAATPTPSPSPPPSGGGSGQPAGGAGQPRSAGQGQSKGPAKAADVIGVAP